MLITFKSAASGDVMMFEKNGKDLLKVLGKDPDAEKGIVTVEQLPAAIATLQAAIAADRTRKPAQPDTDAGTDADNQADGAVQFAQRALPMLELLERSLQEKVPVTWGV